MRATFVLVALLLASGVDAQIVQTRRPFGTLVRVGLGGGGEAVQVADAEGEHVTP